jgi:hypothetical protein
MPLSADLYESNRGRKGMIRLQLNLGGSYKILLDWTTNLILLSLPLLIIFHSYTFYICNPKYKNIKNGHSETY